MDEDSELIEHLLARAGALLEDAAAMALLQGERSVAERIAFVQDAARNVTSLANAADAVANITKAAA